MAYNTNLYNVPIKVLSTKTCKLLCDSLNTLMVLPADNGLLRDWRGLSELLSLDISIIERYSNPTEKLLQLAQTQDNEQKYTIEVLISSLEALNRFDIIDDYQDLFDKDIQQYSSIQSSLEASQTLCQSTTRSYDAMVLYDEADVDFAYNLVDVMEKNYHLRIFVKDRNLKAGDKEVQATLTVIANQSNKLIVILSPDFLTSHMNEFFLDYAQSIAIEQKLRQKIIPCILTPCQMPQQLLGLHVLKYSTNSRWGSFWSRLAESIDPYSVNKQINNETSNLRILQSSVSTTCLVENTYHSKTKNQSDQFAQVSNNSQLPALSNENASSSFSPSSSKVDGTTKKSKISMNNSQSKDKSLTKKVTKFIGKVTKLKPKDEKSKNKKERIAVAM